VRNVGYKDQINVITGKVNFQELEPGYYMRFIPLGNNGFHLYGIEKTENNIFIHENISQENFKNHADKLFTDQLQDLNNKGKVYFRTASTSGGGLDLHTDLAVKYANDEEVGNYHNPTFCSKITISEPKQFEPSIIVHYGPEDAIEEYTPSEVESMMGFAIQHPYLVSGLIGLAVAAVVTATILSLGMSAIAGVSIGACLGVNASAIGFFAIEEAKEQSAYLSKKVSSIN
jgi:hypothetical protein